MGNVEIDNTVINTANVAELFVNTSPEPVTSSAVLGYDSEGRVIPIKAAFEVGFPENANYLYTDQYGTAFPGTAETEVNASNNLITSNAVYNALANVNNSFNDVANNFNDVNNSFNNVNNTANNLLDNVDYLKTALAPLLNLTPANVSGWVNSTTPVNIQGITSFVVAPFAAPVTAGSDVGGGAKLDVTGTTATLALPGFQWTMENMVNTFKGCTNFNQNIAIPDGVISMVNTFNSCRDLPNVYVPDTFTNIYDYANDSLHYVVNATFNQNIKLPSSLTNMSGVFGGTAFNQNIVIPEGVTDMSKAFAIGRSIAFMRYASNNMPVDVNGLTVEVSRYIGQFNQNITIPNSVTNMLRTFLGQVCFNQNILIPNSVVDMSNTFRECYSFNQNILVPNSVTNMRGFISIGILDDVTKMIKDNIVSDITSMAFNQPNMYIFSQNITDMDNAFNGCHINNIHIPTSIPKDTSNFMYNCLVNGNTGITFPAANIFNDLPVDVEQWPPFHYESVPSYWDNNHKYTRKTKSIKDEEGFTTRVSIWQNSENSFAVDDYYLSIDEIQGTSGNNTYNVKLCYLTFDANGVATSGDPSGTLYKQDYTNIDSLYIANGQSYEPLLLGQNVILPTNPVNTDCIYRSVMYNN